MAGWCRYAIYYSPTGPLAAFGASWLGWDLAKGRRTRSPHRFRNRIDAMTQGPRRYGFHATLKPPFRLAPDSDPDALLDDLRAIAADQSPVTLRGGLRLAALDGFPALIPVAPCQPLQDLAARLVRDLDHHRAALTQQDRARRKPERLTPPQRELLERWGYPWVMGQFRFHMTLGGRLPEAEVAALIAALSPHLTPLLPDPHPIESVVLAGEDAMGRFHQIKRLPLTG